MKDTEMSKAISQLLEAIRQVVELTPSLLDESIARALEKANVIGPQSGSADALAKGASVSSGDKAKAAELRDAYLLGKLPENGSLLVGNKEVSGLLNISSRTLSRLVDEKAMPKPVRLGNKVQWRLREIIEWVEADCPPQRHWNYSEDRGTNDRKK